MGCCGGNGQCEVGVYKSREQEARELISGLQMVLDDDKAELLGDVLEGYEMYQDLKD